MKADLAVINGLLVDSQGIYPGVLYIREGKIVMEEGKVIGEPGWGRFVTRKNNFPNE